MTAPIIDETHDPKLQSWVESANDPNTDFPIQNLPLCSVVSSSDSEPSCGVRIGDSVLVLSQLPESLLPEGLGWVGFGAGAVGDLSQENRRAFRAHFSKLLAEDSDLIRKDVEVRAASLLPVEDVELLTPLAPDDYTDFYASIHHATNVGCMFRPDNPILPNYRHLPVGYHGRASSIVASGTPIVRPNGQQAPAQEGGVPSFGPCRMLDYEMEVGFFVAQENELGQPIPIDEAEDRILGLCLLNDWSARDMQKWEYQPLGPFLAKSFATSVSPYVVTMEALAPFRCAPFARPDGDPSALPHLSGAFNSRFGGIDLTAEVYIASQQMRDKNIEPMKLSSGNLKDMYWTIAQMLTHHASNGCNMRSGDLLASGTISGPERGNRGCLLELTWDGDAKNPVPGTQRTPIELPSGETRTFLQDGDEIIMKGYCAREGFRRIGFGECRGIIQPAVG